MVAAPDEMGAVAAAMAAAREEAAAELAGARLALEAAEQRAMAAEAQVDSARQETLTTKQKAVDKFKEQGSTIAEREAQVERLGQALTEAQKATRQERERADGLFSEASALQQQVAELRQQLKREVKAAALEVRAARAAAASVGPGDGQPSSSAAVGASPLKAAPEAAASAVTGAPSSPKMVRQDSAPQAVVAAVSADRGPIGFSVDEAIYLRACVLRLLEASDVNDEEIWVPLAAGVRLDEAEMGRIRLARRSTTAFCLAALSDPTSIADSHPALHAFLLALAGIGSASASVARTAAEAAYARAVVVADTRAAAGGRALPGAPATITHQTAGAEASGSGAVVAGLVDALPSADRLEAVGRGVFDAVAKVGEAIASGVVAKEQRRQ